MAEPVLKVEFTKTKAPERQQEEPAKAPETPKAPTPGKTRQQSQALSQPLEPVQDQSPEKDSGEKLYVMTGYVVDEKGRPIEGLKVNAGPHTTVTDAKGHFRLEMRLNLPPQDIVFSKHGFKKEEVKFDLSKEYFELPTPVTIEGLYNVRIGGALQIGDLEQFKAQLLSRATQDRSHFLSIVKKETTHSKKSNNETIQESARNNTLNAMNDWYAQNNNPPISLNFMVPAFDRDLNTSELLLFAKSNRTFETLENKGDINGYYDHDAQSIFIFATKNMNQRIDSIEFSTPEWSSIIQTVIHELQHFVDATLKSDIEETEDDDYIEQALLEFKHEFRGTFTSGQGTEEFTKAPLPNGFNPNKIRHRMAATTLFKNTTKWKNNKNISLIRLLIGTPAIIDSKAQQKFTKDCIDFAESCEDKSPNPINSINIFSIQKIVEQNWPSDRLTWGDPEYHGPTNKLIQHINQLNTLEADILRNTWWQNLFKERLDKSDRQKIKTALERL